MELISNLLQIIKDYILYNDLNIDKTSYLTIIIGQITIYGILLTFYQFVESYQGNGKSETTYLGYHITDYFVKKRLNFYNRLISKKMFGILFILEIIYKPVITIYGEIISASTISKLNFIWFLFAIGYFIFFVMLFGQCTKSILMIKMASDVKRNYYIISQINKEFLKKTIRERVSKSAVELLCQDFDDLCTAIQTDNNTELQCNYNKLIKLIFSDYINRKQSEIYIIERTGKILRKQENWIYNMECEVDFLNKVIDEKYFLLDKQNIELIINFHFKLIKLNIIRVKLAGYNKISFNRNDSFLIETKDEIYDLNRWRDMTLKIYQKLSEENKQKLIQILQTGIEQDRHFYMQYCKECIIDLIRIEIDCIFSGKREQDDFVKIFGRVIKDKQINDIFSNIIRDKIIYYNRFDAEEIIGQISGENCTYLFSYIVLYYSIYKFRFDWKYINLNVLRSLWKQHNSMQADAEEVVEKIYNSNIGHRFEKKMYFKFMEYIDMDIDGELFNKIYSDKILDVFYVWIIKISVINQDYLIYLINRVNLDIDIQITITNELAKHNELMECESLYTWIQYMRYNSFAAQSTFPDKLNTTLKCLLLANISAAIVANYVHVKPYFYGDVMGEYLLVKIHELSDKTLKQKEIKETVKNAFIASNMDIDKYINMLEDECHMCRCEINYIQKEKMKEYLMKTF